MVYIFNLVYFWKFACILQNNFQILNFLLFVQAFISV